MSSLQDLWDKVWTKFLHEAVQAKWITEIGPKNTNKHLVKLSHLTMSFYFCKRRWWGFPHYPIAPICPSRLPVSYSALTCPNPCCGFRKDRVYQQVSLLVGFTGPCHLPTPVWFLSISWFHVFDAILLVWVSVAHWVFRLGLLAPR